MQSTGGENKQNMEEALVSTRNSEATNPRLHTQTSQLIPALGAARRTYGVSPSKRRVCRATPAAMWLVCHPSMVVRTLLDPRRPTLGETPVHSEHRPIALYTHITRRPPLAYARLLQSSSLLPSPPSHTTITVHRPRVARRFTNNALTSIDISYQSRHKPNTDNPSLLSLGGQQSTLAIGSPPYLSIRSPYCRSVPQTAGILQTATITIAAFLFQPSRRF